MTSPLPIADLPAPVAAGLPAVRERWIASLRSTEPAPRELACQAMLEVYRAIGVEPPRRILWLDSPHAAARIRRTTPIFRAVDDTHFGRRQQRDVLIAALSRIGETAWQHVRREVGEPWGALNANIHQRVILSLERGLESPAILIAPASRWLGNWSLADFDAVRTLVPEVARLEALMTLVRSCGMAFAFRDIALLTDRPEMINLDASGRLHCEHGPALRYRDGRTIHAWRGMVVPADIIETRNKMTLRSIGSTRNAEHRRVKMEIFAALHGPDALLQGAVRNELLAFDRVAGLQRRLHLIDGRVYLIVANGSREPDGTRRRYLLGASPGVRTPHEAVAASYGIAANAYKEAVRT